jgi:hypothetical protein
VALVEVNCEDAAVVFGVGDGECDGTVTQVVEVGCFSDNTEKFCDAVGEVAVA